MAMTNSTSNSPCGLIDSATLTDSQSFSISQILVDVAVSTEDTLPTEVSGGSCLSEEWKNLDGIPCIMGGMRALTASLGRMLCGRTSADFPWKTLPKELAHLSNLIPHIASVKERPSSSEDDDMTGSANDEDESELQFSDNSRFMKPFDTEPPLEPLEPLEPPEVHQFTIYTLLSGPP
ncbi:uncharacterized protein BJ212DRAFT_1302467 [Suillus subaureus]|uniref:Uncharacterized protein n=1 Tax=Suillus subaureus TaxID=48587 RepID=A0A9P7E2E1_9AGAM|nr:uncharacterized protein BJ212DRAFT_1302467 [Suillus subaureus]KAG1809623.1 hypothetical protein BJ212DRAFT_1302467 [Suillus subaureus]